MTILILVLNLFFQPAFARTQTCGEHRGRGLCIDLQVLKHRLYRGPLAYQSATDTLNYVQYDQGSIDMFGISPGQYYFGEKNGKSIFGYYASGNLKSSVTSQNLKATTDIIGPPGTIFQGRVKSEIEISKNDPLWKVLSESDAQQKPITVENGLLAEERVIGILIEQKLTGCHHGVAAEIQVARVNGIAVPHKPIGGENLEFMIKKNLGLEACKKLMSEWKD